MLDAHNVSDLIETLWNVKEGGYVKKGGIVFDLIETLWNVKTGAATESASYIWI